MASPILMAAAKAVAHAYAPYSNFQVGAAVRTEKGHIFSGCNVENASYGLSNCAERSAIFRAVSSGHPAILSVAVVAATGALPYPCGACRQVMSEFCPPTAPIYIARIDGLEEYEMITLGELVPKTFRLRS